MIHVYMLDYWTPQGLVDPFPPVAHRLPRSGPGRRARHHDCRVLAGCDRRDTARSASSNNSRGVSYETSGGA